MRLQLTRRARDDLADILAYAESHHSEGADRVREAIATTFASIAKRPHLGIRNARAPDLRSRLVRGYPYRVHYTAKDAEILIIHIRHSARRPWMPKNSSD